MSANTFGTVFRVTTFGESHGVALGCVIDGCPAGLRLAEADIQHDLNRRRPGQSKVSTARKEVDRVEILAGVFAGKTLGTPIALLIRNADQRSVDYDKLKDVFRPGHADFTWAAKFGLRDHRGGGRSSGRETVARVAAGAVAQKILETKKIKVLAHAEQIGGVVAEKFDPRVIERNSVRAADLGAAQKMEAVILRAQAAGDSVGGVIRLVVSNVPVGLGEPVFDKVSALLGHALLSIGAVKGIEFGTGFEFAQLRGSAANDQFVSKSGKAQKLTNRSGGMLGGITDGSDLIIRIAVKPTASIAQTQQTVNAKGKAQQIQVTGRHDPCLVPRIIPVAEAMVRVTLADLVLQSRLSRI